MYRATYPRLDTLASDDLFPREALDNGEINTSITHLINFNGSTRIQFN